MLNIERKDSKVIVQVRDNGYTFPFSYDCGQEWIASYLYLSILKSLSRTIQRARYDSYCRGWNDAKKRNRKMDGLDDFDDGL